MRNVKPMPNAINQTGTYAVDGVQKATATKATISYNWNTNGVAVGPHLIMFTAGDAAGNVATATVTVTK